MSDDEHAPPRAHLKFSGFFTQHVDELHYNMWLPGQEENPQRVYLACRVPAIYLETVLYDFECTVGTSCLFLNRFVGWQPRPFDSALAAVMYRGAPGLQPLLAHRGARFDDYTRASPLDVGVPANYVWERFSQLELLRKLTGVWAPRTGEVIAAARAKDWARLAYDLYVPLKPEIVGIAAGEPLLNRLTSPLQEDLRIFNALVDLTAGEGVLVTAQRFLQVYAYWSTSLVMDRLVDRSAICMQGADMCLAWALPVAREFARFYRAPPAEFEEPMGAPRFAELVALLKTQRVVLVNVSPYTEEAEQAIRGDLMNAFDTQAVVYPLEGDLVLVAKAHEVDAADFLKAAGGGKRYFVIGDCNRAADLFVRRKRAPLTGLMRDAWKPAPQPMPELRLLQTIVTKRCKKPQMAFLNEPNPFMRAEQLKKLFKLEGGGFAPRTRVLFCFCYADAIEHSLYEGGRCSTTPNWVLRQPDECFPLWTVIERGESSKRKKVQWTRGGEDIVAPNLSHFEPLHYCREWLLLHLKPSDFDAVVLFTDPATHPRWIHEALRLGSRGLTIVYGVADPARIAAPSANASAAARTHAREDAAVTGTLSP